MAASLKMRMARIILPGESVVQQRRAESYRFRDNSR
jgi:hypothetical protein